MLLAAIYINIPNSPGIHLGNMANKDFETRLGLDLVGGVQALLEADVPADQAISAEDMKIASTIVQNRVDGLGVTEAVVQVAGERRIVVELPGETDPERALTTLRQTGLLEFVDMSSISAAEAIALEGTVIQTDQATGSSTVTPTGTLTSTVPARVFPTVMTGRELKTVSVTTSQTGEPEVAFSLTPEGTTIFGNFTSANVGNILAIVLDKIVISAPRIDSAITDGQGIISGQFTIDSANALAVQLRYGSLPIPLKIVETRTVGPTLGQDSLQKSLTAGIIGFIVVVLFMALYYRLPGVVADVAIVIYALIAFAIFRYLPITLPCQGLLVSY